MTLVRVCAWCPDHTELTISARAHGFEVTHILCPACEKKMAERWDREKKEKQI
jgi:hypothetical protein